MQAGAALLANGNFAAFLRGKIYQGNSKLLCVPFLNCYSCPGALGACPVGAFQSIASGFSRTVSLYIAGFLTAVGALAGRFVCGWLCPFGLVQELLHKIPGPKLELPRALEWLRYPVLILTVALPFFWREAVGIAEPYFCKFVCPAGTLEAGLPLAAAKRDIAALLGPLFFWKLFVLAVVLLAAVLMWRPFCRTLCPLGTFYGLFNRVSIWRMRLEPHKCVECGACERACPAALTPQKAPNTSACLRCLECVRACPTKALEFGASTISLRQTKTIDRKA